MGYILPIHITYLFFRLVAVTMNHRGWASEGLYRVGLKIPTNSV